jgi:hypothetical protein
MAVPSLPISWKVIVIIGFLGIGGLYGLILVLNGITPVDNPSPSTPPEPPNTTPQESNTIDVKSVGVFPYYSSEINTTRLDIFNPGYFSIFDILVHLANKSEFTLNYHFDELMNTFVIDSINGMENWWYEAWYSGGWIEDNIFRMDHFPVKDDMTINVFQLSKEEIDTKYQKFREEIERKDSNNGSVIIPKMVITGNSLNNRHEFFNVTVSPHNLRNNVFVNGTIIAIDIIMSLGDQGKIT